MEYCATSMSSIKLQPVWLIVTIACVILILHVPQTACSGDPLSPQDNPCELQRKCPFNPILHHNYEECIVCTGRNLTSLSQGLDPQSPADAAEFRENSLSEIHASDFTNFSRLCYLDLSVNDIATLEDGWAQTLSMLQYLYLSNNKLQGIRNMTFTGLHMLQYLHLDNNLITILQSHTFGRLPHLQVVHLQYNLLQEIEEDAFIGLEQLRKLNLGYNRLMTLSAGSFAGLELLNELILSGNIFSSIPVSGLTPLGGLQHIRMDRNHITTLVTNAFATLTALIELTMDLNNITTLESNWCNGLGMLQYINISRNKVENLSEDIFESCSNVVILDFSHNHLKEIPGNVFKHLQNHQAVDLHGNRLTRLPQLEVANDSIVTDIRLGGNPLMCDCQLSWLKEGMMSGRISGIPLSPDELFLKGHYEELNKGSSPLDAECNEPDGLSGMLMHNVPKDNFTCSAFPVPPSHLPSPAPDLPTTEQYPTMRTMTASNMVPETLPTNSTHTFDLKMCIIVFLAVLSLTLMITLALAFFRRPACRWREQMYFYISDPPLPPRYQNTGHKGTTRSKSSLASKIDDSIPLMLLDMDLDSQDNQSKIDFDQDRPSKSEEHVKSQVLVSENKVEPQCNFCNGKGTISSTGGRNWSVIVHSSSQELLPSLYKDTLQSSCDLHGHSGNCGQATELDRYHQTLQSEASASLARGIILEHLRQCCSFHESIPQPDTKHKKGQGKAYETGPGNAQSDEQSFCNQQLKIRRTSSEVTATRKKHSEEPDFNSLDSSLIKLRRQQCSPSELKRHSCSVLANAFTNKAIPSSVIEHDNKDGKSPRRSYISSEWILPGYLMDSPNAAPQHLSSVIATSSHHRSRSAREPQRRRKHRSSGSKPHRQMSWHGKNSSILQHRHYLGDNTRSYMQDRTNRHMNRPPAPLPRPEATLTNQTESFQGPFATQLTQKSSINKNVTCSDSNSLTSPRKNIENGEETLYFEPIE